jgi:hypothetical protein
LNPQPPPAAPAHRLRAATWMNGRTALGCPAGVGAGCAGGFGPGAEVRVVVTYRVPVARLPFLGAVAGPGLTVGATHHTRVDRFRGLGG